MTPDVVEMAETEAVFREVNERIAETAERFASDGASFVCECADPECTQRVDASIEEYEAVRRHPTRFLIGDGHEVPAIERVVQRRRDHVVVEKVHATVARIVRRLDPRTRRR